MKRGGVILIVLGLVAAGLVYAASPLLAVQALRNAAQTGDRDKLDQLVDFPKVREGLKAQFTAKLTQEMAKHKPAPNDPFAGFALALAPVMINNMVDSYVTADSVAAMVKTGQAKAGPAPASPSATEPSGAPAKAEPKTKMRYGYRDLNTFTLTADGAEGDLVMILRRDGLFGWKLTRIDLPLDKL